MQHALPQITHRNSAHLLLQFSEVTGDGAADLAVKSVPYDVAGGPHHAEGLVKRLQDETQH